MGEGMGYCDLDCLTAICDGDIQFCEKPDRIEHHMSKRKGKLDKDRSLAGEGHTEASNLHPEKRTYPRIPLDSPLEFRMIEGPGVSSGYGAIAVNASEKGLLIRSTKDMPIGAKLSISVFFSRGFQLMKFEVLAETIWKDLDSWEDWALYLYGLRFTRITVENLRELRHLIVDHLEYKESLKACLHSPEFRRTRASF